MTEAEDHEVGAAAHGRHGAADDHGDRIAQGDAQDDGLVHAHGGDGLADELALEDGDDVLEIGALGHGRGPA